MNTYKVELEKSAEELADEIINGVWGCGAERRDNITKKYGAAAYKAAQTIVNERIRKEEHNTATEITYDKIFLPSMEQMYCAPQASGEGDYWEYWKRASGRTTPCAQWQTYPEMITYAIENHNSAQYVRLRSAYRGYSYDTWYVASSGDVGNYYAGGSMRCAPACAITGAPVAK